MGTIIPRFIPAHDLLAFEFEKSISEMTIVLNLNITSSKSWTRTERRILDTKGATCYELE